MQIFSSLTDGQTLFIYLSIGLAIGIYICFLLDKCIEKKVKHMITKRRLNNYKKYENIEKVNFKKNLRRVV